MCNAVHRGWLRFLTVFLLLSPILSQFPAPAAFAAARATTEPTSLGSRGNMPAEITTLGEADALATSPTSTMLLYYALGDSIASGYGLMDDYPDPCHRSAASYPALVDDSLAATTPTVRYALLACSGASFNQTSAQVSQCRVGAPSRFADTCAMLQVSAQFAELRADLARQPAGTPTLVTLTVGIDDLDWTDPAFMMNLMSMNDDDFAASIDHFTQQTAADERTQLDGLLAEYPNVKIVVTGDYNPFNQDSWILRYADYLKTVSPVLSPIAWFFHQLNVHVLNGKGSVKPLITAIGWVISRVGRQPNSAIPSDDLCTSRIRDGWTIDCYDRAQRAIDSFNQSLDQVVGDEAQAFPNRITFAPVADMFAGHESPEPLCGGAAPAESDSWIQYPNEEKINSPIPEVEQPLLEQARYGDCFHPNYDGANAYAQAVLRAALRLGY